jgi:hypothetical protein
MMPFQARPNARITLQDSPGQSVEMTYVTAPLLDITTTGRPVAASPVSMLCRVASPVNPMPALLLAKAVLLLRNGFLIPLLKHVIVNLER